MIRVFAWALASVMTIAPSVLAAAQTSAEDASATPSAASPKAKSSLVASGFTIGLSYAAMLPMSGDGSMKSAAAHVMPHVLWIPALTWDRSNAAKKVAEGTGFLALYAGRPFGFEATFGTGTAALTRHATPIIAVGAGVTFQSVCFLLGTTVLTAQTRDNGGSLAYVSPTVSVGVNVDVITQIASLR